MKQKNRKRSPESSPDFTIIEDIDLYENEFTFFGDDIDDFYEEVTVSGNTYEVNVKNTWNENRISIEYDSTCDDYEFIEYIGK